VSQASAVSSNVSRPAAGPTRVASPGRWDALREELLARMVPASAADWASLEAGLAAEDAALADLVEAEEPPTEEKLYGLAPDPDHDPPDGENAWLADLPCPLREEYCARTARPPVPEVLKAGFWDRGDGDGCGFASGGAADRLEPGAALAGLAGRAWDEGLDRLSDDELIGVLRAARRLTSWSAAMELAVANHLMTRRLAEEEAGETGVAEHAGDEIAAALTLTGRAADRLLDLAMSLDRLPRVSSALAGGHIDLPRAAVIADETSLLEPGHRAAVEERIMRRAPAQTTGQLRASARTAVIAADPAAARRRKERAQRDARVERWTEDAGTGALAGRDLPPTGVVAADQNLSDLARQLKNAGAPGTMDNLRARAYLALLTGRPVSALFPAKPGEGSSAPPAADQPSRPTAEPQSTDASATQPPAEPSRQPDAQGETEVGGGTSTGQPARGKSQVPVKASAKGTEPAQTPYPAGSPTPALAGSVNLTLPLATWLGIAAEPGQAAGYGPLDASDAREIAAALADRANTTWCITFTDADGRAVAHGCASPRGPARGQRDNAAGRPRQARAGPGRAGPGRAQADRAGLHRAGPNRAGPGRVEPGRDERTWVFSVTMLAGGQRGLPCNHARETHAYRPSPALRHLLEIRNATCTYPGCRRPATRCDQDHAVPYASGGLTCECNLGPRCRRHHRAKQAARWRLTQPTPGEQTWTTPSGRAYTTRPTEYD
jgi:hypothetical protein